MPMLADWMASTYYASMLPDGTLRRDNDLYFNTVGPDYFATAGTRVLAGRDFTASDRDTQNLRCILNRSAGAYFFPQGNALGSSIYDYSQNKLGTPCAVVGIVEDMKFRSLRDAAPRTIYWTFMEAPAPVMPKSLFLLLRTDNPTVAASSARQALSEIVPDAPLLQPITMDEQLRESIGRERAMATLAAAFGALALLLTAVGLYGTLSYQVSRRTREIAIRMAVGADGGRVLRMIVHRAVLLTAAGLLAGIAASLLSMRFIRALLFGVKPTDPAPLAFAAAILLVIAM